MNGKRIYADHNATSPLFGPLVARAADLLGTAFANPSSPHRAGREARALVEIARRQVAELLCAPDVVFTASATEANALALEGHLRASGRAKIVVSAIEHPSVLENARRLAEQGAELVVAPVTSAGVVDLAQLDLRGAGVCAVMWANNETGVVQPLDAIAEICRAHGVRFHVDAVQGAGKLPPRVLPCDTATVSGHKLGALAGVGALCVIGQAPASIMRAGGQQHGLRGGTEPVMQAVCFGEAAQLWIADGDRYRAAMRAARDTFERAVGLAINGSGERIPNTSNVIVPGVRGEALLSALDLDGVAVSHGAACATGALEPSHVLLAMGLSESEARMALRISFGPLTTVGEAQTVAERLLRCAERLRM